MGIMEYKKIYAYEDFKDDMLFFVQLDLKGSEKLALIQLFDELYGDTDQATEMYADELLIVIRRITVGQIVINPKYLLMPDSVDIILAHLPENQRLLYKYNYEGQFQIKEVEEGNTSVSENK